MHAPLNDTLPPDLTPARHARLMDQARREALRLRREAMREWASAMTDWFRSVLDQPGRRRLEV